MNKKIKKALYIATIGLGILSLTGCNTKKEETTKQITETKTPISQANIDTYKEMISKISVNAQSLEANLFETRFRNLEKIYNDNGIDLSKEESKQLLDKLYNFIKKEMIKGEKIRVLATDINLVLSEDEFKQQAIDIGFTDLSDESKKYIAETNVLEYLTYSLFGLYNINPTDEEINKFYEENKVSYTIDESFKGRVIYLNTKEKAEEVLKKLKEGKDFIELVQEYSLDEISKQYDGDLGNFVAHAIFPDSPVFGETVATMKVGETKIIEVYEDEFLVFKLEGKTPAQVLSIEDNKTLITEDYTTDQENQIIELCNKLIETAAEVSDLNIN